ncbi:MAG: thioredoxin [Candidatus Lokiarchaeota archaeon]|nr:thioredoxin [Candidatus Lokiarchaeota archaeon]
MEDDEELQELRNERIRELMMKRSIDTKMTGDIIQANSSNFSEIINSSMPVLVDFYTTWCPPCAKMAPIIEALANDYAETFMFAKLNCDEEPSIARQFSVSSIPTFIFYVSGRPVQQVIGAVGRDPIEKIMKSILSGK